MINKWTEPHKGAMCGLQIDLSWNYWLMLHRNNSEFIVSILKQALEKARETGVVRLEEVRLTLGEITGIDRESIRSHWLELSKDTPAEYAELNIHLIKAEVQCMACFQKYHPEGGVIHCPYCGSYGAKILKGEEFFVESIK